MGGRDFDHPRDPHPDNAASAANTVRLRAGVIRLWCFTHRRHSDARWADRVCLDYPPPPRETCAAAARHLTSVFTSKGKACFTYLIRLRITSSITSSTPKLTFKSWNVIKFDETVPSRRRAGPHARTRRCDRDGALCRRRLSYKDPCSILCDATRNPQTPIPKAGALRAM